MISIYTDPETVRTLEVVKKLDPDFNKSEFFKSHLLRFAGEQSSQNMNIEYLNERISQLNQGKREIQQQIDYFQGLKIDAETKQKIEVESEESKKEFEEHKKRERIKSFIGSMVDLFEITKDEAKKLAKEYDEVRLDFDTLFDFMKSKDIKEKSAEDEADAILNMKNAKE